MVHEIRSRGKLIALVDDEDFERVGSYRWSCISKTDPRPVRDIRVEGKRRRKLLSREIMGEPAGLVVDHINGDVTDNRRCNLRICTHAENMRNRKHHRGARRPFKGVEQQRGGSWVARIRSCGRRYARGGFATPEAAALEYDRLARLHHGQFARLNFP